MDEPLYPRDEGNVTDIEKKYRREYERAYDAYVKFRSSVKNLTSSTNSKLKLVMLQGNLRAINTSFTFLGLQNVDKISREIEKEYNERHAKEMAKIEEQKSPDKLQEARTLREQLLSEFAKASYSERYGLLSQIFKDIKTRLDRHNKYISSIFEHASGILNKMYNRLVVLGVDRKELYETLVKAGREAAESQEKILEEFRSRMKPLVDGGLLDEVDQLITEYSTRVSVTTLKQQVEMYYSVKEMNNVYFKDEKEEKKPVKKGVLPRPAPKLRASQGPVSSARAQMDLSGPESVKNMLLTKMNAFIRTPVNTTLTAQMLQTTPLETAQILSSVARPALGQGAQGAVFGVIGNDDYIIKESICPPAINNADLIKSCNRIAAGTIYQAPNSFGREVIGLPDTVTENVIGVILNNVRNYTPGFVENFGMSWGQQHSYSMSERVHTDLFTRKVRNGEDVLLMVLFYMQALAVAQQRYRFTHNDSHLENILAKTVSEPWIKMHTNSLRSPTDNDIEHVEYYVKSPGWVVKINDYGLSRLENHGKTYIGVQNAMRNFGKFSHSVDYLTLFGCIFYPGFDAIAYQGSSFYDVIRAIKSKVNGDPNLRSLANGLGFTGDNAVSYMMYSFVAPSVFNNTKREEEMKESLYLIYNNANYYRPESNNMFLYQSMFLTPDRAILNMLPLLARLKLVTDTRPSGEVREFTNYRVIHNNFPFVRKSVYQPIVSHPLVPGCILYSNILGNQQIPNTNMKSIYNIGDNIAGCVLSQYVHMVAINMKGLQATNMEFVSDCCNIDVAEFFEKPNRFGAAINGVFFNILESNFPIGPYKDKNISLQQRLQIPRAYAPYYGLIGYKNPTGGNPGRFLITSVSGATTADLDSFDFASVCGPVLVDASRRYAFSERDIEIMDNPDGIGNAKIFQCVNPPAPVSISGQFTTPAVNADTLVYVNNTTYLSAGDDILLSSAGHYRIIDVSPSGNAISVRNLGLASNLPPSTVINGGEVVRIDDTNTILSPGKGIVQCNASGNTVASRTIYRYPSCTKIRPGELSHGANLNPRTALAFNENTGVLYFVVIEGRNIRGSGQDFVKMVNTLYSIDSGITMAINLDGGGSSAMAWRTPNDPTSIVSVNPTRQSPYPVGNVFAVINK